MKRSLATIVCSFLIASSAPVGAEDPMPADEVAQKLATVADVGTVQLTTFGRKTGKPHDVPIWFAAEGATIYIWTMNLERDWPRNIAKNPQIELEIGDLKVKGTAALITDPEKIERVTRMRNDKYFFARVGNWFGMETTGTFEVTVQSVAEVGSN